MASTLLPCIIVDSESCDHAKLDQPVVLYDSRLGWFSLFSTLLALAFFARACFLIAILLPCAHLCGLSLYQQTYWRLNSVDAGNFAKPAHTPRG